MKKTQPLPLVAVKIVSRAAPARPKCDVRVGALGLERRPAAPARLNTVALSPE